MADTDLLPPNATAIERALAYVANQRIDLIKTPLRDLWDAQACPAELLPWLAYAYGVDDWDTNWAESERRAAIQAALHVHQHRGTISAIRSVLSANITVQEWFNQFPASAPYTFKLLIDAVESLSLEDLQIILNSIELRKNIRSKINGVDVIIKTPAKTTVTAIIQSGIEITLPYQSNINAKPLQLDGSWMLDGSQHLNGIKQ